MPDASETLDTAELPAEVDPQVYEQMETAFGDDWQHFSEEEQTRICAVLGPIPEPRQRTKATYSRKLLEDLRDIVGICTYRGIEWSPIVAILGYANATTLKNKLVGFNEQHSKRPIHFLTKSEEALLEEIERRLPEFTTKSGRKSYADIEKFAVLAAAWFRLQKKRAFSSQISGETRDAASMTHIRTAKPDADYHGKSIADFLPDDLKAILNPPPKVEQDVDVARTEVQTDLHDTLIAGAGDDVDSTGVRFTHTGEKANAQDGTPERREEGQREAPAERRELVSPSETTEHADAIQPLNDADQAVIDEAMKLAARFAEILASIPAGEENSPKARAAAEAISMLQSISHRIGGNGHSSRRQPLVLGTDVIQLDDETLRGIENGRLVFKVRTHEIVIQRGSGVQVDTE